MSTQSGPPRRWLLWLSLLLASGWLALFGDKSPAGDAAVSLPAKPQGATATVQPLASPQPRPGPAPAEPVFALISREQLFASGDVTGEDEKKVPRDLFSPRSWNPPPLPSPPEQPAPRPVAPPLPFIFLGKKLEGDTWEVFLARGEQTFMARVNQVIENDWRVDRIAPPALTVTYLPLGLAQTVSIGEAR